MTALVKPVTISEAANTDGAPTAQTAPRVVLVTGGTGGIGTEICKRLARAGHIVATTYRNEEKAKAWQEELRAQGFTFHLYKCDVGVFEEAEAMVKKVVQELGPVQILINNAGITRDATLRKMTSTQWRDVITSNLDSVFNVTRSVLDYMLETNFGRIINISSINGQKGQFGQANYAAAKAGMHGFTKALAQEVAKKGITVNTVSPGYIDTDMIQAVPDNIRQSIMAQIPVGRFGKPEDIAHVVAFLADNNTGFITGANIAANGGHFMD
jgi:acetoacetyl-CoA reductase